MNLGFTKSGKFRNTGKTDIRSGSYQIPSAEEDFIYDINFLRHLLYQKIQEPARLNCILLAGEMFKNLTFNPLLRENLIHLKTNNQMKGKFIHLINKNIHIIFNKDKYLPGEQEETALSKYSLIELLENSFHQVEHIDLLVVPQEPSSLKILLSMIQDTGITTGVIQIIKQEVQAEDVLDLYLGLLKMHQYTVFYKTTHSIILCKTDLP